MTRNPLKVSRLTTYPADAIPTEKGFAATIIYFPACIPLFKGHSIEEGSLNDPAVKASLASVCPLSTLWFYSCQKENFLLNKFYEKPTWGLVSQGKWL